MTRRIVLALSHSIEEFDQLRLLHEIGHEVVSLGGYIDPAHPHDDKRPALPQVPLVSVVKDAVDGLGQPDNLVAAQEHIPDAALEWADTIIYHHLLGRLFNQWPRIRDWLQGDPSRRVIWRTVGQSVDGNEHDAKPFHAQGLEIVRYSPKERNIPLYAGEDALIRFYKDPAEWYGWRGDYPVVGNVTQSLLQRSPPAPQADWTHYDFWKAAVQGLPSNPAGPGSEAIGGTGSLDYDDMREYLRRIRVYLYMGTQPASYTLGLIEAMMTGVPVVAMGANAMRQPIFPYVPTMYEAHEIARWAFDDVQCVRDALVDFLDTDKTFHGESQLQRKRAIELFGIDTIREQWRQYLA